jgi:hypothetical protein
MGPLDRANLNHWSEGPIWLVSSIFNIFIPWFIPSNLQGGPDSIRQFLIINNQSIQQHTGK